MKNQCLTLFKLHFQPKRQPLGKTQSLMKLCRIILLTAFKSFNKVVVITNICPTETFLLWKKAECSQADSYPDISYKHTKCNLWHSTKGHLEVSCHVELIIRKTGKKVTHDRLVYFRYLLQNTEKKSKNKQRTPEHKSIMKIWLFSQVFVATAFHC